MAKMTPLPSTVGWVTDKDDITFANKRLVDLSDFEESENGDFILVSGNGNDNEISDEGSTKRLLKKKDVDKGDANNDESSSSTSTIYNTPNRLSQLYVMHQQNGAASGNSQAVASFLKEWYSVDDVEEFAEYFGIDVLDITNVPDTQPEGYGTEAELDVEYMTAMGRGIHTYVWDIEDSLYFVSLVQQLEQTDGRPLIVSMSYGGDEQSNGEQYCSRASIEFAKVGLLGVTFFASSGDNGACGSSGSCGSTGEYLPSFPASSPFVTAVGGTYGGSVVDSNKIAQIEEEEGGGNSGGTSIKKQVEEEFSLEKYNEYCDRSTQESAWYNGGGGFSSFFDRPSYQDEAIENYFNSYDSNSATNGKKLDTKRFNTNGRGYPDISGQAVNYVICDESLFWLISGTSAATPSVAGMFGMINDYRLRNGKTSLGFLNPYLYKLYTKNMKTLTKNEYLNVKEGRRRRMLASNSNGPVIGIGKNDGDRKQLVGDESDMDSILSRLGSISNDNNNNNKNKDKDKDKEDETLVYQVSKNIYFNDVTDGYNQGCGSSRKAFSAIDGWDAATGLGTINFANLVKEFAGVNQT